MKKMLLDECLLKVSGASLNMHEASDLIIVEIKK